MSKKKFNIQDWLDFRNQILELIILYNHVKEYSQISKEQIKPIKYFYHLSKKHTVSAFYIQLGKVLSNGCPKLADFASEEEYLSLYELYKPKLKEIRDKRIAHNLQTKIKLTESLSNEDVEAVISKIIDISKEIDNKFNNHLNYDIIVNSEGIKSLIPIIEASQRYLNIKRALIKQGGEITIKMNKENGEIEY